MATAMSFAMAPSKMGVSSKEVSQVFHQILPKQKLHCFHLFFFHFFFKNAFAGTSATVNDTSGDSTGSEAACKGSHWPGARV